MASNIQDEILFSKFLSHEQKYEATSDYKLHIFYIPYTHVHTYIGILIFLICIHTYK